MGLVFPGIPKDIAIALAKLNNSTVFIETGTFHGDTTMWASAHFEIAHTIELSQELFDQYHEKLSRIKGVFPHFGNSRKILPEIVKSLNGKKALYWLDGHFSGRDITAGKNDECPLLDELACLVGRTDDIILIDDARLFLCAPPSLYNPAQWPTLSDIITLVDPTGKSRFIQIIDDVIFIIPAKPALKTCLVEYAQRRAAVFWDEFTRLQRGHLSIKNTTIALLQELQYRIVSRFKKGSV